MVLFSPCIAVPDQLAETLDEVDNKPEHIYGMDKTGIVLGKGSVHTQVIMKVGRESVRRSQAGGEIYLSSWSCVRLYAQALETVLDHLILNSGCLATKRCIHL